MGITKQEVQEWIEFLYNDLCMDNVLIGGYYFNLQQEDELKQINQKINKQINDILDDITKLSTVNKKTASADAQSAHNKLSNQLDKLQIKLKVKNKFGENITVPCTPEEFNVVYKEFKSRLLDVKHFRQNALEELKSVKSKDISCFMWFLNDSVDDIREKFAGRQYNLVV